MFRLTMLLGALLWQLLPALLYPKADTKAQWFSGRYPGARMASNIIVWHTTETGTWPGYGGGATAPTFTIMADLKARRIKVRQHFDSNESARALRNESGGVDTNTLNVIQVELVGTCAKAYRDKYGYLYWPDAPDWLLLELAKFMVWVDDTHGGYQLRDAAPRGWVEYPASYGTGARQRMTDAEWRKAVGNVGHQHVPENSHGDPGRLNMARMVQLAKQLADKAQPNPVPVPSPEPALPTRVQRAKRLLRAARAITKSPARRAMIDAALAPLRGRK